jgi:hypothetical protein
MRALGFDVKKAEVLKLMKDYDRNETGQVTYSDFVDIMTQKIADRDPEEEIRKVRTHASEHRMWRAFIKDGGCDRRRKCDFK